MIEKALRLIKTAAQAAATAFFLLFVFLLPICGIGGPGYRMDLVPAGQLAEEFGPGSGDRFAHVSLPPSGGGGGAGEGPPTEFFGEERKVAGEGKVTPIRRDPEPIGTAAARAALQEQRPTAGGGSSGWSGGGGAVGRGVGRVREGRTRDRGGEQARRAARAADARAAARDCDDPLDGIRHLGGERYAVDAVIVEHYTRSLDAVQGIVAVRWFRDANGQVEGFQVGNIRCGSPLDQLDIRNMDVILSINGRQVRSLAAAFGALRSMRRNQRVHVELLRRGEPQERFITIR
ncbi:MAG: PDZ domain-containing protein [Deltaproteobacteria bacterium]|nr:MAG: PDZ domain-containing protein [Deltaproteobacteria bacterium]